MEPLRSQILSYIYIMKQKYDVESVSLAKLCYKVRRHVSIVRVEADGLAYNGLLDKFKDEKGKVRYSISILGIRYVNNKGIITMRDWVK